MSKAWMSANRLSKEYAKGVGDFLQFAVEHAENRERLRCPCVKCGNFKVSSASDIKDHLFINGINRSYAKWIWHGETDKVPVNIQSSKVDDLGHDRLKDTVHSVKDNSFPTIRTHQKLLHDNEKPLYNGCSKFTGSSATSKLYKLKVDNRWSDKSFGYLLHLLKQMLPDDNVLPNGTYEAKMILSSMEKPIQKNLASNDIQKNSRVEAEKEVHPHKKPRKEDAGLQQQLIEKRPPESGDLKPIKPLKHETKVAEKKDTVSQQSDNFGPPEHPGRIKGVGKEAEVKTAIGKACGSKKAVPELAAKQTECERRFTELNRRLEEIQSLMDTLKPANNLRATSEEVDQIR